MPIIGSFTLVASAKLRRWTEGATYIRQSGHHVGHWPTFLVVQQICSILLCWNSRGSRRKRNPGFWLSSGVATLCYRPKLDEVRVNNVARTKRHLSVSKIMKLLVQAYWRCDQPNIGPGLTCNDLCKFKCYRSIPHFLPRYFCSRAFQSCIFQPCISSPVLFTFAFWTVLRFYSLISVSQHVANIE